VLLAYMLIQFVDNHYITPKIVASKVRINALIALVVVFIGNALWGIPGMFLAIPVTGILKVIFEHVEQLKPWAFLLGDDMPSSRRYIFNFSTKKEKLTTKQEASKT
jgi:predicted PurR-regulated permease PerM